MVARANTLAEARGLTAFTGLQLPYSLVQRDIERELLPMAEAYGMSVTVWSPLGGGILSGKFTRGTAQPGTRVAADSVSEHDHAVARAVQEVADELGASSSQVAIAWTRARSRAVLPIVGARTVEQLADNLGAVDVTLPEEAVRRLDDATGFSLGFPADFITQISPWVFGESSRHLDA